MSGLQILAAIVLGLIANEFSDISPWAARKIVRWAARQQYGETDRGVTRAEELAALINERPGKLFKLGTASRFASAAAAARIRRIMFGDHEIAAPGEGLGRLSGDEPSLFVARYLFPTERYRGEWKRHWMHLAKAYAIGLTMGGLAVAATIRQINDRFAGWIVAAIVAFTVLWLMFRWASWYFSRFIITNRRLMSAEGLIVRRVAMIPLMRVTDLRYVQSPLGRMLNYGTFRLESANRRNALRIIKDLPNPNELYLRVVEEMYEPAAVEARLGGSRADDHPEQDESDESDESTAQHLPDQMRDLSWQIRQLSQQVAALAAAVRPIESPAVISDTPEMDEYA